MKKLTVTISSWGELLDFIQTIDLDRQTIELVGWINSIHKNTFELKRLIFSTKEVKKDVPSNKKLSKKSISKNSKKQ